MYAGSYGRGVARSLDDGKTWEWYNTGIFEGTGMNIGQIEIDPCTQDVYALLNVDLPDSSNREHAGIYYKKTTDNSWNLLRGTVHRPEEVDPQYTMWNKILALLLIF